MKFKASFITAILRLQDIGFACSPKTERFFFSPLTSDLTNLNAFRKGSYKKQEYFSSYSL